MQSLKSSFENYSVAAASPPIKVQSPLTDTVAFGSPSWLPTVGRMGLLLGAALLMLPAYLGPTGYTPYLTFAGCVCVAASLLVLLWKSTLTLDLKTRAYCKETGFFPLRRKRSGNLPSEVRLRCIIKGSRDLYGQPKSLYTLRLLFPTDSRALPETQPQYMTVLRRAPEAFALMIAGHIVDRLHIPMERERSKSVAAKAISAKATLAVLWTVMFGVVAVMLWPILSGARPLIRPAPPWVDYSNKGRKVERVFSAGYDLYQQKRYKEAEAAFRQMAEENPEQEGKANALNMLAYSLAAQHRMDEALKTARLALQHSPDSGNILDTVGEMHELRHEWKDAARYYEQALLHLATDQTTETHGKYGRTLLALHRDREARLHLEEAARAPWGWGPQAREILQKLDPDYKPSPSSNGRGAHSTLPAPYFRRPGLGIPVR